MRYVAQEDGSWCFVCALANCAIHLGREPLDLAAAKKIARCEHGPVVAHQEVVTWSGLPLYPTEDSTEVLGRGGIISIQHPIYNGHSFFLFPDGEKTVSLVDSWLGPLVARGIGWSELSPFIASNFGYYWVFYEPLS